MLSKIARFPHFLWLNNIPFCVYITHFIKIDRRNINNLKYADDTESEEELHSSSMVTVLETKFKKEGVLYIWKADSLCCTEEINTTL